jgi:hypothetical protein
LGVLFPIFFIQLAAIEHGLDTEFAFYTVSVKLIQHMQLCDGGQIAGDNE